MENIEELLARADAFTEDADIPSPLVGLLAAALRSTMEKIARVEELCDAEPPLQRSNGFCDHEGYNHDGPCAFCRVRAALKGEGE